jgi:hypothetical protein
MTYFVGLEKLRGGYQQKCRHMELEPVYYMGDAIHHHSISPRCLSMLISTSAPCMAFSCVFLLAEYLLSYNVGLEETGSTESSFLAVSMTTFDLKNPSFSSAASWYSDVAMHLPG